MSNITMQHSITYFCTSSPPIPWFSFFQSVQVLKTLLPWTQALSYLGKHKWNITELKVSLYDNKNISLYLPTFSDKKVWDFHQDIVESLCSCLKMPENLRGQSERFWTSSNHLRNSVPGYPLPSTTSSLSKIGEYSVEELSFTRIFSIHYCFEYKLHVYVLHTFQGFARYGCNNSYFPVRHEKLAYRCNWPWYRSFRLAGVWVGRYRFLVYLNFYLVN